MDIFEAIKGRRTIRKYSSQPVEFEKLMLICEAGHNAPSSGNLQNWRFLVVTEKDIIKDALYHACLDQDCVSCAQAAIIIVSNEEIVERHYGLRGKRLYAVQNCAAAAQNMLLAAHALGLGANWIGAFNEEKLKSVFNIPESARPQIVITLGYPAETPNEKRLRHIDDVIWFNRYKGRYKDMHLILKDLSVKWQKDLESAKYRTEETRKKAKEKGKSFLDQLKEGRKNKKAKKN